MTSPEVRAMFEASVADLASRSQPVSEAAREAEPSASPGERLYQACYEAFSYRGKWEGGSPVTHRNYERAATAFIASDPLLKNAPRLLKALIAIVRGPFEREDSEFADALFACAEAAIAAASPTGPEGVGLGNTGRDK